MPFMTPDVTSNVNGIAIKPELTNALHLHDFGTSMSGNGALKFELLRPFTGVLNSTVLDT